MKIGISITNLLGTELQADVANRVKQRSVAVGGVYDRTSLHVGIETRFLEKRNPQLGVGLNYLLFNDATIQIGASTVESTLLSGIRYKPLRVSVSWSEALGTSVLVGLSISLSN